MESPKYMKRKVKAGNIEVDFEERALIVHYEVEATVVDDYGEVLQVEKKAHKKRIRLKTLNVNTNIRLLAQEIVEKCKLIHPSKLPLVEKLVYALQQRWVEEASRADSERDMARRARRRRQKEKAKARERQLAQQTLAAQATMDSLDDYLEKLYDEKMNEKIAGTASLLQLARHAGNLEEMVQNEPLMGALSRVLKEEYKKSMDLVINIMYIFFSFSNFSQMHPLIMNYRVGNETMRVIDLELKRHALRNQRLEKLQRIADLQSNGEAVPAELWAHLSSEGSNKPTTAHRVDMDRERRKVKHLMRKQEKLLYVCFHVLVNLAEDVQIERKMVKRNIGTYLAAMLDRTNAELLILVVTFLKKLSIFEENKTMMVNTGVVEKVVRFMDCNHEFLLHSSLRLLFNLSFDSAVRDIIVKNSIIPKLVELLKRPQFRAICLRLLYHLSMDDRCKSMFTYAEAMPLVMQLVINFPQNNVARELVALAVNLSHNARNAELMCKGDGLRTLVHRVLRTRDPLLMKVVRNLSQWTYNQSVTMEAAEWADRSEDPDSDGGVGEAKDGISARERQRIRRKARARQPGLWQPYIHDFIILAQHADNPALMVEVLATLANMTPRDLPEGATFADLVDEHGLVEFMHKQLVPGFAEDDVILLVIMLVGTLAQEEECARLISRSPLVKLIHGMLRDKADDDEIVLQVIFVFYRILLHPDTHDELVYDTDAVPDMCELLAHGNPEVRRMTELTLQLVMDKDVEADTQCEQCGQEGHGEMWCQIRSRRFELHNREWIEAERQDVDNDEFGKSPMYLNESDASGARSDDDRGADGEWGHIGGGREDIAMDMGMLGEAEAGGWEDARMRQPDWGGSSPANSEHSHHHAHGGHDDTDEEQPFWGGDDGYDPAGGAGY